MNPMITSDLDLTTGTPDSDFDEKQPDEVANITPDDSMDSQPDGQPEPQEILPAADDHETMKNEFFKEIPDLETLDETIHTWNIKGWRRMLKREYGPVFNCGDASWRILFFPFGNNQNEYCSFYLEQTQEKPSEDWYACVQFMLVLWNPNEPTIQVRHTATHRYNADESDWGFTRFQDLRTLTRFRADGRGVLEDDCANVTAFVRVIKDPTGVLWHSFNNYDSKKETGMVGLKNQGATCYLNSLLQSLFFTNAFRKAIYQIPTENETDVRDNSAYALQRLFYLLQTSDTALSTNDLTTSFGWESRQIFEQQDVQEFSRILMDKLEGRMKGTQADNALSDLFVGRMKTYISCINVDYESSRPEDFWDIQLNVRGNATLDDSFKDYIQVETMDGDNKYFAEGHGLQDARKGVIFESFPQVLHLQLKRFEYNFQADAMTKIYDRYEFPEVWDASPYLSESADRSEPYIYHLHGVLVHSGDLNAGHYYAFLKPKKNGHFYKFDDDRVTRATIKEALDENYGGDFGSQVNGLSGQRNPYTRTWSKQRFMSAYMLVYIRESRLDNVLRPIAEDDVPAHLERKINEERAELERRRKEREEAHLYMQVFVGTDDTFRAHQGFDIFPAPDMHAAPGDFTRPRVYRLLRSTTIETFNEMIATEMGVEKDLIRPWGLVGRQNGTIRPDTPLVWEDATLEEAASKMQAKLPLRLWIEVASRKEDGTPDFYDFDTLTDAKNATMPILLFLKHFDAKAQTLTGITHVFIEKHRKVAELGAVILDQMSWSPGVNLRLYEEIKQKMIDTMNTKSTFAASELQHGDIVCFQQALTEEETNELEKEGKYSDPPHFYNYLVHRTEIVFSQKDEPDPAENHFTLELSKIMTYDQIAAKVGTYLGVDPTHLRFTTVHQQTNRPRSIVKRGPNVTLHSILTPQYGTYSNAITQRQDWLLYEELEISLAEMESKKLVKITMLSEGISKEELYEILVPKNGTVADLVEPLREKADLSDEDVAELRFVEAHSNKVYKELPRDSGVQGFNEFVSIYAEVVPEEERDADPATDRAIYAFHFEKEPTRTHGVPFKFVVKPGEVFADTRERLSNRTGIKGKQLEKIKFAVVSRTAFAKPEYLKDDDVLFDKLVSTEDQLGLEHINKNRPPSSKADVMMIR